MRYMFFIIFLLFHQELFAQFSDQHSNLELYIGDPKIGMQINSSLTATRTSKTNQEFDLNLVLFYQDKYLLKDDEVIGFLNGRLISETPLSAYDILEEVRSNNAMEFQDFAAQFPEYQKILSQYQLLLNAQISNGLINEEVTNNYYEYNTTDEAEYQNKYIYNLEENYTSMYPLKKAYQTYVAQQFSSNLQEFISTPSMIEFIDKHSNSSYLNEKELEFLVNYEELKSAYNKILSNYNIYLSNEYQSSFDPADPKESFTVVLMGDSTKQVWSKKFGLDGQKNYQSHNNTVWYLGYALPLTKKDVLILNNIFQNNTNVSYYIKGTKNTLSFSLKFYVIRAFKELLELYARGKLIIDLNAQFPILRNE